MCIPFNLYDIHLGGTSLQGGKPLFFELQVHLNRGTNFISSFIKIMEVELSDFFSGGGALYISCMFWEVKIDMSGQSNDCLRVCNVKMNIFLPGHISKNVWVIKL